MRRILEAKNITHVYCVADKNYFIGSVDGQHIRADNLSSCKCMVQKICFATFMLKIDGIVQKSNPDKQANTVSTTEPTMPSEEDL